MSKRDSEYQFTHRNHDKTFPWKWFIFFLLCLLGGVQGLVFFTITLVFVKVFTKMIRF